MNKEIHYEGWLIKSPPTKRILRARWRRRWFTLKQGEIPEQFCLEYYTDRNCRKLKGVIDLDQCEQVDSGLRLENRKQKFPYMFDIKTPRRTYYLAADTESDMRDWVNCICQVCHLHDIKQSNEIQDDRASILDSATELVETTNEVSSAGVAYNSQNELTMTQQPANSPENVRQSLSNDSSYVNTSYSSRDTFVNYNSAFAVQVNSKEKEQDNFKSKNKSVENVRLAVNSQGVARKIPDNLVLNSSVLTESSSAEPSSALSTSSGPYIPISECFSGSPKCMSDGNPLTPLNNLDPKFYDTPRSHNNIGLNLTNDQSYSPKITNCALQTTTKARSGRSSPTDSESVFTDDDEWTHPLPLREKVDRSTRPSDSSVENELFVFTYSQRFSKLPGDTREDENNENKTGGDDTARISTRNRGLMLDIAKENEKVMKDINQLSDTENTSPAIGPKNALSYVDESYDIPRSHNLPYYNMAQFDKTCSPDNTIAVSTPNLLTDTEPVSATISNRTLPRPHCYTNAAPMKMEGNVFRYDFVEQTGVPPVNRKLKPKVNMEDRPPEEMPAKPPIKVKDQDDVNCLSKKLITTTVHNDRENSSQQPPSIDRKTKPSAFKQTGGFSNSINKVRRSGIPEFLNSPIERNSHLTETRTLPRQPRAHTYNIYNNTMSRAVSLNKEPPTSQKDEHKLQYFDLDVSNPPPINRGSMSTSNLVATGSKLGVPTDPTTRAPVISGVVYNVVDFVKTDAFKKIREERKMGIKKL